MRARFDARPLPHDERAETAVVGALMYNQPCREEVFAVLTAADFYLPDTRETFRACRALFDRGLVSDPVTVSTEQDGRVATAQLLAFVNACPSSRNIASYVAKVQEFAARRSLRGFAEWTDQFTDDGEGTAGALMERVREEFEVLVGGQATSDVFPELDTLTGFLETYQDVEEFSPWLIPGLVREAWKMMLVGGGGAGKSTLLRMLAIAAAGGVHPFTQKPIDPVRTMLVDLENPPEAIIELCKGMHDRAIVDSDNCWIVGREQGMNLRTRADRVMLESTIAQVRPKLVVMGPVYKMVGAVSSAEEMAAMAEAMFLIDRLRVRYGTAFVLEHHPPHGDGYSRNMRPSGTSLWERWPHLGLGMTPIEDEADDENPTTFKLTRFRKDRVQNEWPKVIRRSGGVWPWAAEQEF